MADPECFRIPSDLSSVCTDCESETLDLGEQVGRYLAAGDRVLLEGELGSGKTVFARGVAKALGVDPREVRSPSFTLVNIYRGRVIVYHVDLYRLETVEDLSEVGLEEWMGCDGLVLVEWGERLGPYRPHNAIFVKFEHAGENRRKITLRDGRTRATVPPPSPHDSVR